LIHADHAQRGTWDKDKSLQHVNNGHAQGDYAIQEEINTIGLPGATTDAAGVSENDLRSQLGYAPRVSYHDPAVFDGLKAEAQRQQAAARAEFEAMVVEQNRWYAQQQAVWRHKAERNNAFEGGKNS
jgi:hypothetical protein